MLITKYYSPNFSLKKRSSKIITQIILHYTGMQSERESLKRLTSPKSKVSCHYVINRNGKIFRLVEDKNIAWHAGKSMWGRYKNLNKNSIGIELVNKGHRHGYQKFTKAQIRKLIRLCKNLKKKYKIKNKLILGHSDIAPLRKRDPGEKFPWQDLSSKGIGIYPVQIKKNVKFKKDNNIAAFFKNLNKIGYRYLKRKFKKRLIKSFQRRYRQRRVDGILDVETFKISEILAKKSNIA
tara:strand:+ start:5085 stop:5795 length:711 start_codon:yes stop_codon:yes gene_type:complete